MTDDVPRLYDARHGRFGNAQDVELFLGPFFFDDVVAESPAGHGAPVDEGILGFKACQVH